LNEKEKLRMSELEMAHPPDPEMRNRPAGDGTAYRKLEIKREENNKSLADIQASRLSRLYALSLSTASTIAALAYGVVR
jgi:hypothetical protein